MHHILSVIRNLFNQLRVRLSQILKSSNYDNEDTFSNLDIWQTFSSQIDDWFIM